MQRFKKELVSNQFETERYGGDAEQLVDDAFYIFPGFNSDGQAHCLHGRTVSRSAT